MDARLKQASPIVVVGMHRSGTRVVVDVLARLGVFMGADRQGDAESVTFMLINEQLLQQCGAFWSEPMSAHFLLAEPSAVEQLAAAAEAALAAALERYGGAPGWPYAAGGAAPPFGWKDPRNTFTLPVWKRVFPNLRAVHIVRHGVDAAASLARRHTEALRAATGDEMPSALTVIRDHALGVLSSRRGWTLAEAFTMWEQYVEKARLESAELGARALEIRYEELVTQPGRVVPLLAEFCGVAPPARLEALLDGFEPGRAFAYRNSPKLVQFAESQRAALARCGYSP